jgi:hypothetical protein
MPGKAPPESNSMYGAVQTSLSEIALNLRLNIHRISGGWSVGLFSICWGIWNRSYGWAISLILHEIATRSSNSKESMHFLDISIISHLVYVNFHHLLFEMTTLRGKPATAQSNSPKDWSLECNDHSADSGPLFEIKSIDRIATGWLTLMQSSCFHLSSVQLQLVPFVSGVHVDSCADFETDFRTCTLSGE